MNKLITIKSNMSNIDIERFREAISKIDISEYKKYFKRSPPSSDDNTKHFILASDENEILDIHNRNVMANIFNQANQTVNGSQINIAQVNNIALSEYCVYWAIVNFGTPQIYKCLVEITEHKEFFIKSYKQVYADGLVSFPNPPDYVKYPFDNKIVKSYWVYMEKIDCFFESKNDAMIWCGARMLEYANYLQEQSIEKRQRKDYVSEQQDKLWKHFHSSIT